MVNWSHLHCTHFFSFFFACLLSMAKYVLDLADLNGFGNFPGGAFKAFFIVLCEVFRHCSVLLVAMLMLGETSVCYYSAVSS